MPLTILDLDDVEALSGGKLDKWLNEFSANFMRPVTDAAISAQLQAMIAPLDPSAAHKIHLAMGGNDGED